MESLTHGLGLAWLFRAWPGLASGLRPEPAHHYSASHRQKLTGPSLDSDAAGVIDVDMLDSVDQTSMELITRLKKATARLPDSVAFATADDALARFSGDPSAGVSEVDEAWEMVDQVLNGVIGYGVSVEKVAAIIRRGSLGMDGLCNWLDVCVRKLKIGGALLEGKVQRLMSAIDLL